MHSRSARNQKLAYAKASLSGMITDNQHVKRKLEGEITHIVIYGEEHRQGEIHYHMDTDVGQKKVFMRFMQRLPEMLPKGFHVHSYRSARVIGSLSDVRIQKRNMA